VQLAQDPALAGAQDLVEENRHSGRAPCRVVRSRWAVARVARTVSISARPARAGRASAELRIGRS
jgi:hypothetical protein